MSDSANVRQISDVEAWSIEQRAYDILTGRRIRPLNKHEQKVYADIITRATSDGWFPSFKMGFAVLVPFIDATARTAYVDQYGRLGLSYELIYALPFEEQVTIIVHEVMHMLSNHITRGKALGFADLLDCNIVSDLEVNTALERSPKAVLTTGILPQNYNLPVMKTMEWYFKNWNDDLTELKERQQEDPTNGLPKPRMSPPPSQDGSNDPKADNGQQPNQDAGDNPGGDSQSQDNSQGDGDSPQEADCNQGDAPDSNEDTQAKPDIQDGAPTQEGSQDDISGDPTDTSANSSEDSNSHQDTPGSDSDSQEQGDNQSPDSQASNSPQQDDSDQGQCSSPDGAQGEDSTSSTGSSGGNQQGSSSGSSGFNEAGNSGTTTGSSPNSGSCSNPNAKEDSTGGNSNSNTPSGTGGIPSSAGSNSGPVIPHAPISPEFPSDQDHGTSNGSRLADNLDQVPGALGDVLRNYKQEILERRLKQAPNRTHMCDNTSEARESEADDAGIYRQSVSAQNNARDNVRAELKNEIASGKAAGNGTANFVTTMVNLMAPPKVAWQDIFRRKTSRVVGDLVVGKNVKTYTRTDRRYGGGRGQAIFPGKKNIAIKVTVGVDQSSSIDNDDNRRTLGEVAGILKEATKATRDGIKFFTVDTEVKNIQPVKRLEDLKLIGGGGTRMGAAFEYINSLPPRDRPDLFVLATDGFLLDEDWENIYRHVTRTHNGRLLYRTVILVTNKERYDACPMKVKNATTVICIDDKEE